MGLAFIQNIGGAELLWIILLIALLFGAKRIPEVARSLGRSLGEFKKGKAEAEREAAEEEKRRNAKETPKYDQDERSGSGKEEKSS